MRTKIKVFALISALALAFALLSSTKRAPQTPAATAASIPNRPLPIPAPLARESFLRMQETADGFAPLLDLPPENPASHWKNPAKPVVPSFPKNFADAVRVTSGVADVQARPVNARASAGKIASDGTLVYAEAFDGCDVSYRCTNLKTEEFLTVKSATAPTQWSWELDTHGLKPRLTPAGTIELCDTAGVPRLRINAPDGKDANGKLLRVGERLALSLDGSRVTLAAKLDGCAFPVVIDPTWSSTGTMAVARIYATITSLGNGTVLVAGGLSSGPFGPLASCELFDEVSETWSSTGTLGVARWFHTANLLQDGTVVVAGGRDSGTAFSSSEIYDPNTRQWTPSGAMVSARLYHQSVLLQNGKVLVVSGSSGIAGVGDTTCQLYDPILKTWAATGSLSQERIYHAAILLASGNVLTIGGVNNTSSALTSCEQYDSTLETWATVSNLKVARASASTALLSSGDVLVYGGGGFTSERFDHLSGVWNLVGSTSQAHGGTGIAGIVLSDGLALAAGPTQSCEVFSRITNVWTSTSSLIATPQNEQIVSLSDGKVLVANSPPEASEIFDPSPSAQSLSVTVHTGMTIPIMLSSNSIDSPTLTIVTSPSNGTISGTPPNTTYKSTPPFVGTDSFTYQAADSLGTGATATVTIIVTNQPPDVTASASATAILEGQSASFTSTASDLDGDALTYLWNFGDGSTSTDPNPAHAYATAGTYQATCTVTDIANASTTSNAVTITVYHDSDRPTARFTTSDLNGFVGQPLGFDATFSTDPLNNIVSYDWDFGDGSPHGAGQLISRVYAATGTYTVTLTITDGRGLSDTTTLTMVVLPAEQAGLLNSNIKYSVSWNRGATNADSLSLSATINTGSTPVSNASPLSLNVVGQTFTGNSATKLSNPLAKPGAQVKFQLKANTKKGSPKGTYDLKCTIKHASLGQAFALAGVTGSKSTTAKIPLRLGIGASSFESSITSQFRFGSNGAKASGGGQGPK